jgi:predicted dienelactone hydrolase
VAHLDLVDAARGRGLATELWYPATAAGPGAPLARGRFPLVLVAHGFCGSRLNYEYLTVHLASRGFVVAAPDFPGFSRAVCDAGGPVSGLADEPPADLSFLRRTFRARRGPARRFAVAVDRGRRTGLVGHSLGGTAVVRAALADAGFAAVVALAPAAGPANGAMFEGLRPRRAVMAMGGTADTTVSLATLTRPFFEALPSPAFLVSIVGGTHGGFSDVDARLAPDALARQQALVRRYATAFLGRYVGRQGRAARLLTPADAATQGTDVIIRSRI